MPVGRWRQRAARHSLGVMRRTTSLIAALAAVVMVVGPLAWVRGWLAPVMSVATAAVAPIGHNPAEDPDEILREQVARLGAENALLRSRLSEYAAIQGEGGIPPERVVVARGRIIARTRRAGRRFLELDVGRVDGVAKGMAVTMGWSLVGQVSGTDDGRCLVQEITDSESRVAAVVMTPAKEDGKQPERLCEGVLAGNGKRQSLTLDFIDSGSGASGSGASGSGVVLEPGLQVVTAGSDGRFPATLVLGTILTASHAGTAAWHIEVAPARDPEVAESLLVVRYVAR